MKPHARPYAAVRRAQRIRDAAYILAVTAAAVGMFAGALWYIAQP